jgi:hypothetical protein
MVFGCSALARPIGDSADAFRKRGAAVADDDKDADADALDEEEDMATPNINSKRQKKLSGDSRKKQKVHSALSAFGHYVPS